MSSPYGPEHAPAGDVGAVLMMIDSRLKSIHDGTSGDEAEQRELVAQFTASLGPGGVDDLLDGACTLIYLYMTWLRKAHEDHGKDVIEYVVPTLVASMRMMPRSIGSEAIPTMAGLVTAAGIGLSPSLWRKQYGEWTEAEMTPLEATVFLLAEHINRIADDRDFATRLITEALTRADEEL
ncbi:MULTISPECIES: hypothetical protein [unclassified Streptomyces]|uniref:hypothetical protein n=1 Tax=unclassified Streptomyces TaxID=2593676 RepID=UPI00344B7127